MPRTRAGWRFVLAVALAAAAAAGAVAGPGAGTPPCAPLDYAVAYAASTWNVTILGDAGFPLAITWYVDPWNGTLEPLSDHVGRPARAAERVTFQDADGSGNVTASDVLGVWDPDAGASSMTMAWGENASAIGATQGVVLQDGYRSACGGAPGGVDPVVLGALVGIPVLVALLVAFVVLGRRSRRARRAP